MRAQWVQITRSARRSLLRARDAGSSEALSLPLRQLNSRPSGRLFNWIECESMNVQKIFALNCLCLCLPLGLTDVIILSYGK
jgi:hypothetical protein